MRSTLTQYSNLVITEKQMKNLSTEMCVVLFTVLSKTFGCVSTRPFVGKMQSICFFVKIIKSN